MRLFSAVFPPDGVRRDVHAALQTAPDAPRLRWTPADRLHLTLVFLADVAPADLRRVIASVDAAAAQVGPFEVELHGLGGFPRAEAARVLTVDVARGGEELSALHRVQCAALGNAGFDVDARPLRPHLTIARPRRPLEPGPLAALVDELAPWRWRFTADEIRLVESRLRPAGAEYVVRHATGLKGR